MDRLETFFIKTVTAAEEQAQPTSGAVSTTRLGDFLVSQTPVEGILDKLVSARVSPRAVPETPLTEQPEQEQVKKSILDQLTGRSITQSKNKQQTEQDKSQAGDSSDA